MRFLSTDLCFYICTSMIMLCCIIYYYSHKTPQKDRSKVFELIMFNMLFTSIAASVATMMNPLATPAMNFYNYVQQFAQTIYFALHTLLAPLFALYVVLVNNWGDNHSKKSVFLFLSPAFLLELFVLTNPFTGLIFYYQDNVLFTRGPMELLIYAEAAGYLAFTIQQLWLYRSVLLKTAAAALWIFIGCCLLGVMVQFLFQWFKLELFCEAISLMGVMLLIEMEDSHTDSMTGVYNRHMFIADNERYIRSKRKYMVMVLTLLNFKSYLRMFKNEDMEEMVKNIVLWVIKNSHGTVYRIGQDKIGIITTQDRMECDEFATLFKEFMHSSDVHLSKFNNVSLPLSASIDIVRVPDEIPKPELLTELGDESRDTIKPGLTVHREEDIEKVKRRVELEQILQKAIQEKSFEVHYQPIWNAENSAFDCAEALVRLYDPVFGNIPPMEFIPIAEQNGMINDIGRIVFEKVCKFFHDDQPDRFGLKEIEVNLSIFQLYVEDTDILFRNIMEKYGVTSKQINLEITESAALNENGIVKEHYEKLRRLGFTFSLDDFGTGYSNLIQVIYNEFKNIKSDKGLLWDTKNPNSHKFLVETINMIRKFRLDVIQEGVETKEQLELVLNAGANKIQGYYFSKPLDAPSFLDFIRSRNASTNPVHA